MSKNSFKFGNAAFKGFISQAETLNNHPSHLAKFCSLANVIFPTDDAKAAILAKRCTQSLKKKADLLSKIFPNKFKHTERLNLAANLCFFPSWKAFNDFADSFPNLSDSQRRSSGDTLKLCASLIQTTDNRLDDYSYCYIAIASLVFSDKTGIPKDEAGIAVHRIFTEDGSKTSGDYLGQDEIMHIVHLLHNRPHHYYLMYGLSHSPLKFGVETPWSNLSNIDVGKFLQKTVMLPTSVGNIPSSVKDVMVASILAGIHEYAESQLFLFINPAFDLQHLKSEQRRIISALARDNSRVEAEKVVDSLFSKIKSLSVLEAITHEENCNGFINTHYLHKKDSNYGFLIDEVKSTLHNHQIRVYRDEPIILFDNKGGQQQTIRAVAFDFVGEVSGYAEVKIVTNPSGSIKKLGIVTDEIEDRETIEMALSLASAIGYDNNAKVNRVGIISGWEVARGQREGKLGGDLLNAVFDIGLKNVGHLDFVLAKLEPAEYPIPPLENSKQEAIPNYSSAKKKLREIWDKTTKGGTSFGSSKIAFHEIKHSDVCHGHPNLLMLAMTLFQISD